MNRFGPLVTSIAGQTEPWLTCDFTLMTTILAEARALSTPQSDTLPKFLPSFDDLFGGSCTNLVKSATLFLEELLIHVLKDDTTAQELISWHESAALAKCQLFAKDHACCDLLDKTIIFLKDAKLLETLREARRMMIWLTSFADIAKAVAERGLLAPSAADLQAARQGYVPWFDSKSNFARPATAAFLTSPLMSTTSPLVIMCKSAAFEEGERLPMPL